MKKKELKKCFNTLCERGSVETKLALAACCPADLLWELEQDDSIEVRCAVVKRRNKGILIDVLMSEEEPDVLAAVAETGFGLAILSRHESPVVRCGVAEGITRDNLFERKILDNLLNDPDPTVRAAAIEKSFQLFGRKMAPYYNDDAPEVQNVLLDLEDMAS